MIVAILGAGNGGASAVVELGQRGFTTRLWNRSPSTLAPFQEAGGVKHTGVFGEGIEKPEMISADLNEVIDGADVVLICLPTLAHAGIAKSMAALGANRIPVVLNPGHTGGALEFAEAFSRGGLTPPPTAEFSTLTYVARKPEADTVWITGSAEHVWVAALPGGESAVSMATTLYPAAESEKDVIATGLANVNMVLHTPGAILGASWVEATRGDFTFYVEGLSDGVGRIMQSLDAERLQVAAAYGHMLPDLFTEMQSIGTIEKNVEKSEGLAAAVRAGEANSKIKAPDSLEHRYYREDFWYGIKPFIAFADIAGVEVPVATSLMNLASVLAGEAAKVEGRSAKAMGIDGLSKNELLDKVSAN